MSSYVPKKKRARRKQRGTRTKQKSKKISATKKRSVIKPKRAKIRVKKGASKKKRSTIRVSKKGSKKKSVKKKSKKISKAELQKEVNRLQKELEKLRNIQEIAVGEKKKSPKKRRSQKIQVELEEKRLTQDLKLQNIPVFSSKQTLETREEIWARMRKRFWALLNAAKKSGQLPKAGRARVEVNTRLNIGEEIIVRINRLVNPSTIEQILYEVRNKIKKLSGDYSIWWSSLAFTGFGERLIGSKPRILDIPNDPDARFFQTEGWDNTGVWNSEQGMVSKLEDILNDYASSARTIIYLNFVRVMNFDRKD